MSFKIEKIKDLLVITNTDTWEVTKRTYTDVWYKFNNISNPILYSLYQKQPEKDLVLDKLYSDFLDDNGNPFSDDSSFQDYLDRNLSNGFNTESVKNSTSTLLVASGVFTGEWEDVSKYNSITIAAKTDQNGMYTLQFSPDGVNQDSTLTRYYRTNQIEPPHRFTITRKYARIEFTNTSSSDQTYLRLQTLLGDYTELNTPLDSVLSQDFDSISVRSTKFEYESALGRRQGSTTWNKFGYNSDVDVGTEVLASFGGSFSPLSTDRTLSIVSDSSNDINGGTGAHGVVVYGINGNWEEQTVVVFLNGLTPVVTNETWLGVNRIALFRSGSSKINEGVITATATTDLTIQGQIEVAEGTSQQCMFFIKDSHQGLIDFLLVGGEKTAGGTSPRITFRGWVYSEISNSKYLVFRQLMDTDVENHLPLIFSQPLIIGERSVFWIEATTDKANTEVNGRFSLIEFRDVDS
ncbi:MAG: hypothetical protein JXQ96_23305 [Cyclobacteriaceae bacterium]